MGKKSAPDAPDLKPYADALAQQGEWGYKTAQDQLAWAREQDAKNRALLDQVLGPQLAAQQDQQDWAREDRSRYTGVYQPLEDSLIKDFQSYGTPERMAQERGRAMADVASSFDAQRRNALQRLESFGVDPSQTRSAALDVAMRTQQGAAMAAGATNAQRVTEDKARAMRADAINIGRGMPSQVAQSYGQSVAAGSQAVGGANSTFGASAGAMGTPAQWAGLGQAGYAGAGNMMNTGYQGQLAGWQAGQQAGGGFWGGVGQLAGMASMLADGRRPQAIPTTPGHIAAGPGDGSGIDDQVPATIVSPDGAQQVGNARLSTDEYVIPADVVRAKGVEFFDKLLERYHRPAAMQRAIPA